MTVPDYQKIMLPLLKLTTSPPIGLMWARLSKDNAPFVKTAE
jgi:restriction endonuclease Mrr